jgi:hypothetical protein
VSKGFDPDDIHSRLAAMCEATAEQLEMVGYYPHTCGQCKNCAKLADGGYYCAEKSVKSDDGGQIEAFYNIREYDSPLDDHGIYSHRLDAEMLCDGFDLLDDEFEKPYYRNINEWLTDQLDFEYVISSDGEYKCGIVITYVGGPNIEVDTRSRTVKGFWWSDMVSARVNGDVIDHLDEALKELYESARE